MKIFKNFKEENLFLTSMFVPVVFLFLARIFPILLLKNYGWWGDKGLELAIIVVCGMAGFFLFLLSIKSLKKNFFIKMMFSITYLVGIFLALAIEWAFLVLIWVDK